LSHLLLYPIYAVRWWWWYSTSSDITRHERQLVRQYRNRDHVYASLRQ